MRIQRIDTTNFGYNKRLNTKLVRKLENEDPTALEETLIIKDLNTLCNDTEDLLRLHEAIESEKSDLYYSSLLPMKILLSKLVDYKYPELNFTEKEIESYEQEAYNLYKLGEDYPWQFQLATELDLSSDKEKNLTDEQQAKINELMKAQKPVVKSVTKEIIKHEEKPLPLPREIEQIEVFKPNFSSPKGFESIGGMNELKEEMRDKILTPVLNPELAKLDFEEYGKRAPRGIMFWGPPGCGKTFMAEALSTEAELPLLKFQISKVGSKYINETSNNYQKAFEYAEKYAAAVKKPVILFIDEIDGFTHNRSDDSSVEDLKQMGTLLNMIETARDKNVIVIGATNKYDIVDDAIKRRFDEQIYIGLPDEKTREDVLKLTLSKWLKGKPLTENPDDIKEIASKLNGFPTSAIVILADKASNLARKDGRRDITKQDMFDSINKNQNLKIDEKRYKSRKEVAVGFKN